MFGIEKQAGNFIIIRMSLLFVLLIAAIGF